MSIESNLKKIVSWESKLNPKSHTIFRLDSPNILKFSKKLLENNIGLINQILDSINKTVLDNFYTFRFSLGYVSIDEIILYIKPISKDEDKNGVEMDFNGRIQKMISHLTSKIAIHSYKNLYEGKLNLDLLPYYECKVWQVDKWNDVLEYINERCNHHHRIIKNLLGSNFEQLSNETKLGMIIMLDKNKKIVSKYLDSKNILLINYELIN